MAQHFSRRDFLKTSTFTTAGVALGAVSGLSAKNYTRILGANDRLNVAVVGVRSRGAAHIASLSVCDNVRISHLCDVDQRFLDEASNTVQERLGESPVKEKDIRKLLEMKEIDAISIATPDHWHAPMGLLGLQAGKHVYIEKPLSHNPAEGVMLLEAEKKYGKLAQMGNQQRSSLHTIEAMKKIKEGVLGEPYFGKAWYNNKRKSIGVGKTVPVPEYLDWELWQGPAPRKSYKDNYHPYKWHWFWNWGTGETLNNGTHEVDLCVWALGVGYPNRVSASGGRYNFKDDWEFYDTMVTSFEYDGKMITWEGKSCNNMKYYGRDRGATIHGTEGTLLIDRNGYEIYNNDDEKIFEYVKKENDETTGLVGEGPMTDGHFQNFINAIRTGEKLHSPLCEGNISVTMLHLSNIAWKTGHVLELDPSNGHIENDKRAMELLWKREYEPGWEPQV
jgi:predicted dehydrogenase